MALTITEAQAVQRVTAWVLALESFDTAAADEDLTAALPFLAERARRVLGAGVGAEQVERCLAALLTGTAVLTGTTAGATPGATAVAGEVSR